MSNNKIKSLQLVSEVKPANQVKTLPRWRRQLRLARAQLRQILQEERGAVTAEYAILIMAAVAFAGLLVVIMRSGEVQAMLTELVQNALNSANQ